MVVVTTDQGRGQSKDVYDPPGERGMAHHSYLSPDSRWVLIVKWKTRASLALAVWFLFGKCGRARRRPPNSTCTSGAWSPDGKWVYLTAKKGDKFHIWRQRFPSGEPEQVTSGPPPRSKASPWPRMVNHSSPRLALTTAWSGSTTKVASTRFPRRRNRKARGTGEPRSSKTEISVFFIGWEKTLLFNHKWSGDCGRIVGQRTRHREDGACPAWVFHG